ncbi:MAG TPA: glycosyltransferase family 2 protein [Bryobacteraceae bacterium]
MFGCQESNEPDGYAELRKCWMLESFERVLVAIPAYNEQATIADVVRRVRASLPEFDLLVINDGSTDSTPEILRSLGVIVATHLCNLGYGRAIQTAIKYAHQLNYDVLITVDADGQHHPEQVHRLYRESRESGWDLLIGSRYIETRDYSREPIGRRMGMQLFSIVARLLTGRAIYDTTSGLKIMRRSVFVPLARWHCLDFHAEAIVYLLSLGYRVGESPISVAERTAGQSMYSFASLFQYPVNTGIMTAIGAVEGKLVQRRSSA